MIHDRWILRIIKRLGDDTFKKKTFSRLKHESGCDAANKQCIKIYFGYKRSIKQVVLEQLGTLQI